MLQKTYTLLCPFGGLGAGALGFLEAETRIFQTKARFELLGGVDFDAAACADFEYLTGVPEWNADVWDVEPAELRARFGQKGPDVVFMSPPCLPGREPVLTPEGEKPIEQMRAGDFVLTHRGRYRPIVKVGTHVYEGAIYGVRLHGTVEEREFTGEHPLWVRRATRPVVNGKQVRGRMKPPVFMPASELRVGDRIGFPVETEERGVARAFVESFGDPQVIQKGGHSDGPHAKSAHTATLPRIIDLRAAAESSALWFLLGAYIGDGYRRAERHEVVYCVGSRSSELSHRVRGALTELGITWNEDADGGESNIKIRLHARHLCQLAGAFGDGAETKDIPPMLMRLDRGPLDALIAGLRATDGSEREARRTPEGKLFSANWKVVSTSLPLLRSMQRLILRLGEYGAIHKAWPGGPQTIMGRDVQTLPRWEVKVSERTRRGVSEFADGAVWVRVRSIAQRAAKERVWNLEVDDDDTFCVPMMATHNCKGASGLLSEKQAKTAKYRRLNQLALRWVKIMLEAWADAPPRLVLFENVPRIVKRAARVLGAVKAHLRRAGYVLHDGFHDCGAIGGLAQHRRRYLLVARHKTSVPSLLYKPVDKRVRACGEVLGPLPIPNDPAAGPMHRLPNIGWLNWVRLALIPAGGDWRDLPGVLEDGQERREVFKRHAVEGWDEPTGTIGGSGSNSVANVADPRVSGKCQAYMTCTRPATCFDTRMGRNFPTCRKCYESFSAGADDATREWFRGQYGVLPWEEPAGTITGMAAASRGAFNVADPRGPQWLGRTLRLVPWGEPSGETPDATVRGVNRADPYGVVSWTAPSAAVTGSAKIDNARAAVADPRIKGAFDHGYKVTRWDAASDTIAGGSHPGQGAYSVADVRVERAALVGIITLDDARRTVTGDLPTPFAAVDPSSDGPPVMVVQRVDKAPPVAPVILAADGTWHRPLTTLELAVLQGLPAFVRGAPLLLSGSSSSDWRERIGNAVPVQAATAIAEQMLLTLLSSDMNAFSLSSGGGVWVAPEQEAAAFQ